MAESGSSNQLNLLGHAERLAKRISDQYNSKPEYEMIKTIMPDIGEQKVQLLLSPLPCSPQPRIVISSKLERMDGVFYYM
jgi:hypothetical protein